MRILVLGAGVLGCNLAMNLFRAGKDVTLLARGDWGRQIEESGLTIRYRYSLKKRALQASLWVENAVSASNYTASG